MALRNIHGLSTNQLEADADWLIRPCHVVVACAALVVLAARWRARRRRRRRLVVVLLLLLALGPESASAVAASRQCLAIKRTQ